MKGASIRRAKLLGLASVAVGAVHCDPEEYPLQPTFCDDWCRVFLRVGCNQEPENCVRNCEHSRPPAACVSLERDLLACYQAQPASAFGCSDEGFAGGARPDESTCPAPRDALIDCAYPEVKVCLDGCRDAEAMASRDAGAAALVEAPCPTFDIPCDSLCWAGRAYVDRIPADSGAVRELSSLLMACAVARADACRSGADGGPSEANWASVLEACVKDVGASFR